MEPLIHLRSDTFRPRCRHNYVNGTCLRVTSRIGMQPIETDWLIQQSFCEVTGDQKVKPVGMLTHADQVPGQSTDLRTLQGKIDLLVRRLDPDDRRANLLVGHLELDPECATFDAAFHIRGARLGAVLDPLDMLLGLELGEAVSQPSP